MEIVMIGRGVIAAIYGKVFADAGNSVRHLVKSGRSAELGKAIQVDLLDARAGKGQDGSSMVSSYTAKCFEGMEGLATADLVFACVRADQLASLASQLRAAPLPKIGIVFFNNCWDEPASIASGIPADKAVWAFPMAGGGFAGKDRLVCALQRVIHMEAAEGGNAELGRALAGLFASIGIETKRHSDIRAWLWRHFALNAGFQALTSSRGIGMAQAMESSADLALGLKMVKEATKVAEARGLGTKSESGESTIARLPAWIAKGILRSVYKSSPIVRRMMDIRGDGASLAEAPLRVLDEARRLGIACPGLEAAAAKFDKSSKSQ